MNVLRIRNEMRSGKTIFDLPLRVTFYARVSTDKDEQINSLENQIQYYTELIQSKPNWTYIEGYHITQKAVCGRSASGLFAWIAQKEAKIFQQNFWRKFVQHYKIQRRYVNGR